MKKCISLTLILFFLMSLIIVNPALSADMTRAEKEDYANSLHNSGRMSLMSLNNGGIGNDYVNAVIADWDGTFSIGLKRLDIDDWFRIVYGWSSTGTSFTTLRIDGSNYNNWDWGSPIQAPQNINGNTANEGIWRIGDVSIKQVIQTAINPATGLPDAALIRYVLTNAGDTSHEVGLRIMIDTQVGWNDSAPFKVPSSNGIESVDYERDYFGNDVPDFWQAFEDLNNPDISAQYSMRGGNATPPDRLTIANWGSIYDTKWDYTLRGGNTGDSAVGMWWNPTTLAPGETRTVTTYYGRPGVGGTETLILTGPSSIPHSEWSVRPLNLVAYLNNNTASNLNNVSLEISTPSGISLIDNDPIHQVGNIQSGLNTQTSWRLQPTVAGTFTMTVNAFEDGSTSPFATAEYTLEALEPAIPENVTIEGPIGIRPDGTPVVIGVSPLTITGTFDPHPVGVTLVATDDDRHEYQAEMTYNGSVWTHTFYTWYEGLLDRIDVQLIPRYPGGTTGTPAVFEIALIDPSGYVYNVAQGEDWRLPGATVNLQYFDLNLNSWVDMSDEAYPNLEERMDPITNPQTTNSEGKYAWDVAAGYYRVKVSRPGFADATSREVTIPPEVTDLHVGLTPTDTIVPSISYSGVTDGETYNVPVTIQLTASDDSSGVRSISYTLDSEAPVNESVSSVNVNVSSLGTHSLSYSAVDYAGNTTNGSITFTIEENITTPSVYDFSYLVPASITTGTDTTVNITFASTSQGAVGYDDVYFQFAAAGPGDVTFKATDSIGVEHSFTNTGTWGSPGFNLPAAYSATTPFILNFSQAGGYAVTFKLVDNQGNTVAGIERTQNITVSDPVVVPSEFPVTVTVMESDGFTPISGASVKYRTGSVTLNFGTTDENGQVTKALASGTYGFTAGVNGTSSSQEVAIDQNSSSVNFQTAQIKAEVKTNEGSPVEGAGIVYKVGSTTYHFGPTDANGSVTKELFPGTYGFIANYKGTSTVKEGVSVDNGSVVSFQTTNVKLQYSGQVKYKIGSTTYWPSDEMFPGTYTFLFDGRELPIEVAGNRVEKSIIVAQLLDSQGIGISGGKVSWADGPSYWAPDRTNENGILVFAINGLRGNIRVNMIAPDGAGSKQATQYQPENSIYVFQTGNVTTEVNSSVGEPLIGAKIIHKIGNVTYHFGTTDGNGLVTKELFPGTYGFIASYKGTSTAKDGVSVDNGSVVSFQTAKVRVNVTDSDNNISGAKIKYYKGGVSYWFDSPYTDINGNAFQELFPGTYEFQGIYNSKSSEKVEATIDDNGGEVNIIF